jgi:hypothetical protein
MAPHLHAHGVIWALRIAASLSAVAVGMFHFACADHCDFTMPIVIVQ